MISTVDSPTVESAPANAAIPEEFRAEAKRVCNDINEYREQESRMMQWLLAREDSPESPIIAGLLRYAICRALNDVRHQDRLSVKRQSESPRSSGRMSFSPGHTSRGLHTAEARALLLMDQKIEVEGSAQKRIRDCYPPELDLHIQNLRAQHHATGIDIVWLANLKKTCADAFSKIGEQVTDEKASILRKAAESQLSGKAAG